MKNNLLLQSYITREFIVSSLSIPILLASSIVIAQDAPGTPPQKDVNYSTYIDNDFPNQILFGDTHLHTSFSSDAGLVGNTLGPEEAYRFAKGEGITSSQGVPARLPRPLDFLVVADHAENLGLPAALIERDPVLLGTDWGNQIAKVFAPRTFDAQVAAYSMWISAVSAEGAADPLAGTGFAETMWKRTVDAAERHNVPGSFTALIGFEWTSMPNNNNLHRVVIFRDGKDKAEQIVPISAYDTEDPEEFWNWLQVYEAKTKGQVLAIPHNGNLSNGLMFDDLTFSGKPIDAAYAKQRMRWEPLYEVTQMKGDAEAHPLLSPDDTFANFETWDKGSFGTEPKKPAMLPKEYARPALRRGLAYDNNLNVNPFKFGLIGSTDSHTSFAAAEENNYYGKVSALEPTADPIRFEERLTGRYGGEAEPILGWQAQAAGLTAVWSRENSREAIWDAMKRKEVFGTTGSRIRVRVFGGFNFNPKDLARSNFAEYGYANGVPMGGDLIASPKGKPPGFLIRAIRDPDWANLDRIQVVKGWALKSGETAEKVYDVAWSGKRIKNAKGTLPLIGNTVDTKAATWSNSIGSPILETFWQDPEFDSKQRAFYYVRVIEIPTPRWTTYDRKVFGVDIPDGAPLSIQERAYTSPIWYSPK